MTAPYRGPRSPMPFPGHRPLSEVFGRNFASIAVSADMRRFRQECASAVNEERLALGWTIAQLANTAGLYRQHVSEICAGEMIPTWETLQFLLLALDRGNPSPAQRINATRSEKSPAAKSINRSVLADTQVLASDSAMTARRETGGSSPKLSDRVFVAIGAVALSSGDSGAPASPSCARERSREDTSPPFGLRPLAQENTGGNHA